MKKIALATVIAAAMAPAVSQADILFTVGAKASQWQPELSGQLEDGVSVEKDGLNLESDSSLQLTAYFKHPVPLVPNIKLRNTPLEISGTGNITQTFLGKSFNGSVKTELDLSHTDLTLIWGLPIPLPLIDINFGLTARQFDGAVSSVGQVGGVQQPGNPVELNFVMPMVYGEFGISAPFGLYAQADVNYIGFEENQMTDINAVVGYELPVPIVDVALEAGYRMMSLKTDEETADIATDVEISGTFFGLGLALGF